ncbi:MAG: cytochrome c3 family protein [Thermodesulfobacteriota bacterium]
MPVLVTFLVLTLCSAQNPELAILIPDPKTKVVYAPGAVVKGICYSSETVQVRLLRRSTYEKILEVSTEEGKRNFAKEIRKMFPEEFILTRLQLITTAREGTQESTEYHFPQEDVVDLKMFWASTEFREILAQVYDPKIISCRPVLSGWSVETRELNPMNRERARSLFSFRLPLIPGENPFYVQLQTDGGGVIVQDSVKFFYEIEALEEGPSDEFVHSRFHYGENEKRCVNCHPELEQEDCRACHAALLEYTALHPPAGEGECLACHDSDSSPKYQLVADMREDPEPCLMCHSDKEEELVDVDYVHPPAGEGCLLCHDPHGSRHESLVVMSTNRICAYCHEEMAETPHPVSGHPLGGSPDPSRPGRELTCASCHNPHASEYEYLLTAPEISLCAECHPK